MSDAISISHVSYRFGDHLAVEDLSLDVHPGEIFGLLGPNGAGKTTTIRLINTLLPLQDGEVYVYGHDLRHEAMAVRRRLGYVPQQLSIEGGLTGRENVMWFARLFDVPRAERAERVDEVLAMVDLTDVAGRLASTYSGGMVRRLELAQAPVNRPAVRSVRGRIRCGCQWVPVMTVELLDVVVHTSSSSQRSPQRPSPCT